MMSGRPIFCLVVGWLLITLGASAADSWHKVASPHFTIIAQGSSASARAWARDLDQFIEAMKLFYPIEEGKLEPVHVVIFKNDKALEPFKPKIFRNNKRLAGAFMRTGGRNLIVMRDDDDLTQAKALIFHEATHWYMAALEQIQPQWLEEGLAEMIGTFRIEDGRGLLGGDVTGRSNAFRYEGYIPLIQLLNSPPGILHHTNSEETSVFYAESWLLVSYFMTKEGLAGLEKLKAFAARTRAGEHHMKVFPEVFGMSYDQMDKLLFDYAGKDYRGYYTLPGQLVNRAAQFRVQRASEDDVDFTLGLLLLTNGRAFEAEPYFDKIRARSPNDPRAYEGLGGVLMERGDRSGGTARYAEAAALGSDYFFSHFYPQINRIQIMIGTELAADRGDPVMAREAVESLKKTIHLKPSFYPAYEALAGLMGALAGVTADDEAVMKGARERFPSDAMLEAGQVAFDLTARRVVTAKNRIDRLKAGEYDSSERAARYTHKLERRLAAMVNLGWAQRYLREGQLEQARQLLDKLNGAPLLPAEYQKYNELVEVISASETFSLVRERIAEKNWDAAAVLLRGASFTGAPQSVLDEAASLQAEIAAAQK